MQSESNAALDNARHEVEFCYKQLTELEPYAKALSDNKPREITKDNLIQNALSTIESSNFDKQFRDVLIKTMMAQVKYIKLLEERIGK
jgi:hypothetical protein